MFSLNIPDLHSQIPCTVSNKYPSFFFWIATVFFQYFRLVSLSLLNSVLINSLPNPNTHPSETD